MSEESEEEKFRIEKVEVAGDVTKDSVLSKSVRELTAETKHTKLTVQPYFCQCGKRISKDNALRCSHCEKLVCQDCGILYLNEIHCKPCLAEQHQISLTKSEYILLLCVSSEITSSKKILQITGMKVDIVKEKINSFMDKYLTEEPASIIEKLFRRLRLTDLGNDALQVFERLYGNDLDCLSLKKRIAEYKSQREKKTYRLRGKGESIA